MMGTFMKGAFIAGLAAFNWALAAPVTTPSSLDNLGAESANTMVSSPGLSRMQSPFSSSARMYSDANPSPVEAEKILLQKREIALLEALCKATKGCVLPQP